jgi:serine/threonine protein kinase/Tol biopolymer transport system component
MTLPPGSTVGCYEIVALLGAGGMGEVYRARDTRLKREVAIKVLPAAVARDAHRLARFRREAEALAALNHPNIAAIYGLEERDGVIALILELVEGPTLADRLAAISRTEPKGRGMAPGEALPIARQIADALESAHASGIIHRDLKPANIKVRPDGTVKVLDFGLAKILETGDSSVPDASTHLAPGATQRGGIVGTPAYMSPEQATGRPTDRRTDVWSFGCVLFELLTGRAAFDAGSTSEIIACVLKSDPEWRLLPSTTPAPLLRLLRRTLEKDDKRRLRDIADARLELDETNADAPSAPSLPATVTAGRRGERIAWLTAIVVAAGVAVAINRAIQPAPSPPLEMHVDITTPAVIDPQDFGSFALSPDGQQVVFNSVQDGRSRLMVRALSSANTRVLPADGLYPFWSPDSRSIGFSDADGFLKRIDLDGGLVRTLTIATMGMGGSWSPEGIVLFSPNPASPIWRVSAEGGERTQVTTLVPGQAFHSFAHFLPGFRNFLYFAAGRPDVAGVYVDSLGGSKPKKLVDADAPAVFARGHLLFIRQGTLFGQRFDTDRLELVGAPFPIADGVAGNTGYFITMSATAAGTVAFRSGAGQRERQMVWFDRTGSPLSIVGERDRANPTSLSSSPDGNRVALFRRENANSDVWLLESKRGLLTRFTTGIAENIFPSWSRDGARIAFTSNPDGGYGIYLKRTTGADPEELLVPGTSEEMFADDWSPDGRFLIYERRDVKTGWDLWALPLDRKGSALPVATSASDELNSQFSPDGRWLAYASNTSRQREVYIQPFPGPGPVTRVSTNGGDQIRWRSDGRELFFVAPDARLMAAPVAVTRDGQVEVGTPAPLFRTSIGRVLKIGANAEYVVSADGQRFLMNTIIQNPSPAPIRLVMNWKAPNP